MVRDRLIALAHNQTFQVSTWLSKHYGHKTPSYYNSALTVIRDALDMAVKDKIIIESPARGLKYRKRENPIRLTPTFEQFKAIVADIRAQRSTVRLRIQATSWSFSDWPDSDKLRQRRSIVIMSAGCGTDRRLPPQNGREIYCPDLSTTASAGGKTLQRQEAQRAFAFDQSSAQGHYRSVACAGTSHLHAPITSPDVYHSRNRERRRCEGDCRMAGSSVTGAN